MNLDIDNILTTNYDLSFERIAGLEPDECRNEGLIKERLYNLYRYHRTNKKKIWHIHGSESAPNSITLGYEHYSGYLQQMRNYVTSGIKGYYKEKDFQPLKDRIKKKMVSYDSWIDYFFTHDIYILGLNFDFVEMHLWWLITYRGRAIVEGKILIRNNIYYFYPLEYSESSKHKLEMFDVNGVRTISEKNYKLDKSKYYQNVIERIKNGI